jgi:hypothetical protein
MAAVLDKKALMRDKRAQGIAAMGLVNREGDRFRVTTPTLRGRRASYEVWRDEAGRVRCTCLEFEEQTATDPRYRCEHILAVKHAVLNKSTEAAAKQAAREVSAPQAQGATPDSRTARDAGHRYATRIREARRGCRGTKSPAQNAALRTGAERAARSLRDEET